MTTITLTISASADVLAAVLATLGDNATASITLPPEAPIPGPDIQVGDIVTFAEPLPMAPPADTLRIAASATGVDADGIKWDERIHSANGAKKADGRWRKRRGVSDEQVALVEAEVRAASAPPVPLADNVPPLQAPTNAVPPMPVGAVLTAAPAEIVAQAPTNAVPPMPEMVVAPPLGDTAPAGNQPVTTVAEFMKEIIMPATVRGRQTGVPFDGTAFYANLSAMAGVTIANPMDFQGLPDDATRAMVAETARTLLA